MSTDRHLPRRALRRNIEQTLAAEPEGITTQDLRATLTRRARAVGDEVVPTVTLSLSSIDFVRLGCGRASAAQVEGAGGLALSGDAAVGRAVLDAMNFMV